MEATKYYLNEIVKKGNAFCPETLVKDIINAGWLSGLTICGGFYDYDNGKRVLYIA